MILPPLPLKYPIRTLFGYLTRRFSNSDRECKITFFHQNSGLKSEVFGYQQNNKLSEISEDCPGKLHPRSVDPGSLR